MRTTEMLLFAHFLKPSKFIPACISIYILSLTGPFQDDEQDQCIECIQIVSDRLQFHVYFNLNIDNKYFNSMHMKC